MTKINRKNSIKTISFIFIFLSIIIPVLLTNSFFFNIFSDSYREDHEESIVINNESVNHSLEQYLNRYSTVFDVVASSPVWDKVTELNNSLSVEELKDYYTSISLGEDPISYQDHAENYVALVNLIDAYESNSTIRAIYIGTPEKYVFTNDATRGYTVLYGYDNGEEVTTFDCTTRPWYTGAVESEGDIYWASPYIDKDQTSIVLSASKAIYDESDNLVAVISMDILSEDFVDQVVAFRVSDTYQSFIVDKSGQYIFGNKELIGESTSSDLVNFLSSDNQFEEIDGNVYTKTENNQSGWFVIHSYSVSNVQEDISNLIKTLGYFAILITILSILLVIYFIRKFVDPIVNLTNYFIQIEETKDITNEIPVLKDKSNHKNEIGQLYKSVKIMQNSVTESVGKVEYLIYHDMLTNINNRSFFENELKKLDTEEFLPLSIAMIDLNGLKLINDTFGHQAGDELLKITGNTLLENTRGHDVVARWGGDEFVVLFPKTPLKVAKKVMSRIYESAKNKKFEYGDVSLAIGVATKEKLTEDFQDTFRMAEELMYQEKNNSMSSVRSETLNTIINTLFEKSPETENHSQRVSELASMIAQEMHLPENKVNDIRMMGTIHDIGKIVIDSSILEKKTPIDDEERTIIQSHAEIGSRILSSTNKHTQLIPGILHHHERWDGKGYPHGLKGVNIPLESRIICVADAFDAMISIRYYKPKPMSVEEAIQELERCKNTQFDSAIVDIFIKKVIPKLSKKDVL